MSAANPKFTKTGKARTSSDKPNYLKPQHWADERNHFWNATQRIVTYDFTGKHGVIKVHAKGFPTYTEKGRDYHNGVISDMLKNRHNLTKIANSQ